MPTKIVKICSNCLCLSNVCVKVHSYPRDNYIVKKIVPKTECRSRFSNMAFYCAEKVTSGNKSKVDPLHLVKPNEYEIIICDDCIQVMIENDDIAWDDMILRRMDFLPISLSEKLTIVVNFFKYRNNTNNAVCFSCKNDFRDLRTLNKDEINILFAVRKKGITTSLRELPAHIIKELYNRKIDLAHKKTMHYKRNNGSTCSHVVTRDFFGRDGYSSMRKRLPVFSRESHTVSKILSYIDTHCPGAKLLEQRGIDRFVLCDGCFSHWQNAKQMIQNCELLKQWFDRRIKKNFFVSNFTYSTNNEKLNTF